MKNFNFEKPDVVFLYAPVIQDICIEFGIDRADVETITCMYEVFKRVTGKDKNFDEYEKSYNEGYESGWDDALEEVGDELDDLSWKIGRLKKN